ncbi:MAG: rluC [Chlamydiales bacterium]|jgi:RluA family pseudouridine synthase|nr:rluC [Chlamydiales bacterium]
MTHQQKKSIPSIYKQFFVTSETSGLRLDRYLKLVLGSELSLSQVKWAIEHNLCRINKQLERFVSTKTKLGDFIELNVSAIPSQIHSTTKYDSNRILYEDEAILIYDKPPGISCDEEGLFHQIKVYCKSIIPIHRLDKETSGAILFAKQPELEPLLIKQFRERTIKKKYCAIVDGSPKTLKGTITNYLGKIQGFQGCCIWGEVPKNKGVLAETIWQKVESGGGASLMHCWPQTGRTHQIRIHMSQLGFPILGDRQYSKHFRCPYKTGRLLLHALSLEWIHPIKNQIILTCAEPPEDIKKAIDYIRS